MKIYVAGPMRGIPLFNFPAFHKTAAVLRGLGHEVFNPAECDVAYDDFDPATSTPRPMSEYKERDLPEVCKADAVVVLSGGEKSEGAKLEIAVARKLGKLILRLNDLDLERIETRTPLQEADDLIHGSRNASYGPPNQDFQRTADMWTGLLQYKLKDGERIRAQDVSWMMMLLKASRAQHSDKRDNSVDAAGYASLAWRCAEEEQRKGKE